MVFFLSDMRQNILEFPYILKVANFQAKFWGKKFRGLNICAKTLIFGILTLDRLFLKPYTAIFLILIFLPDMACESCLNWQNMAKIVIFQL